ncbi:Catalase [compost metagenome]
MRIDGNFGAATSYVPNSSSEWDDQADFREPILPIDGPAGRFDQRVDEDHFEQPGNLYRLLTEEQKLALISNTVRSIKSVSKQVQMRHVEHCRRADHNYGERLEHALGLGGDPCSGCPCACGGNCKSSDT